jgi:TfoX/Sxy family transcriptional regulator of competence genes
MTKENKTTKLEILQATAWKTPEELDQWQRGVAQWLNERRSKKATKKKLITNKTN